METNEDEKETKINLTSAEEADAMIDHCIEVESNQRMRRENISTWTLHFKQSNMEEKVCKI